MKLTRRSKQVILGILIIFFTYFIIQKFNNTSKNIHYKEFILLADGIVLKETQQRLNFGMSLTDVRNTLGLENFREEHLLVYHDLGLTLYIDTIRGLSIIAYFSNQEFNPFAVNTQWDIENITLNAGTLGTGLHQASKKLYTIATMVAQETPYNFVLYGNKLRLGSDTRNRLAMLAYYNGDFHINPEKE